MVAYPDRGAGNDPELFFFFFFFFLRGGGGGGVVFHNQGSTFLQWAIYESNDLPRPRRSALSSLSSCETCKSNFSCNNFSIIDSGKNDYEITVKEALHNKFKKPTINRQLFTQDTSLF